MIPLAKTLRAIDDHRRGAEMVQVIAAYLKQEGDTFDVAEALYYLAANYGAGKSCPLRAADALSGFRPGMGALSRNEPHPETSAHYLYSELSAILERK